MVLWQGHPQDMSLLLDSPASVLLGPDESRVAVLLFTRLSEACCRWRVWCTLPLSSGRLRQSLCLHRLQLSSQLLSPQTQQLPHPYPAHQQLQQACSRRHSTVPLIMPCCTLQLSMSTPRRRGQQVSLLLGQGSCTQPCHAIQADAWQPSLSPPARCP